LAVSVSRVIILQKKGEFNLTLFKSNENQNVL